jgi:rhodanese-related sulfurtransferase
VDVRATAEMEALPLADCDTIINIPLDQLRDRLDELDPSLPTIVACRSGLRSYLGTRVLKQHGFAEVYNLSGATAMREFALNRRLPAAYTTTPTGLPAPDAIMID